MSKATIAEQLDEARREKEMRSRIYPVWCKSGRLRIEDASHRARVWGEIIETLAFCQAHRDAINSSLKSMTKAAAPTEKTTAMIREANRELALRERLYADLVKSKRMTMEDSATRLKRVRAIIGTLQFYERNRESISRALDVLDDPSVRRFLEVFPGAELSRVHDRAAQHSSSQALA